MKRKLKVGGVLRVVVMVVCCLVAHTGHSQPVSDSTSGTSPQHMIEVGKIPPPDRRLIIALAKDQLIDTLGNYDVRVVRHKLAINGHRPKHSLYKHYAKLIPYRISRKPYHAWQKAGGC